MYIIIIPIIIYYCSNQWYFVYSYIACTDLEWLQTPMREPTPTPEPATPAKTPTPPPPSSPPPVEIKMDPYERRLRKAQGGKIPKSFPTLLKV